MENAALIGLSRQIALGRELDVIANNMANVSTNGYKARQSRFKEFLMPGASAAAFRQPGGGLSVVAETGTALDPSPGAIERTGNPLDAAIKGDGFFVVQTPAGERYTRNGAFTLNAQGQLVTSDGHTVMGESGPIAFSPQETGIEIGADRTVSTTQGSAGSCGSCALPIRRRSGTRVRTSSPRPPPPRPPAPPRKCRRARSSAPT